MGDSRCRLRETLITLSSVKLFRLVILAHSRCVGAGASPTWIQQTVSCAYRKSMAVVCLVLADSRLWTVMPLSEVAWMFWELAINRTGRRSTGTEGRGGEGGEGGSVRDCTVGFSQEQFITEDIKAQSHFYPFPFPLVLKG